MVSSNSVFYYSTLNNIADGEGSQEWRRKYEEKCGEYKKLQARVVELEAQLGITSTINKATDAASNVVSQATQVATEAASTASSTASGFLETMSHAASSVAATAMHVVDAAKEKLGMGEEKKDDDDIDLFSDEKDEAWEAEVQRRADEQAAKKKAANEASGKAAAVMKSAVVVDVKPWEDTTDLVEMEKLVRGVEINGLEWKASKLVPIGYGIKKLQISCHIVDDLVSMDDVQEKIEGFSDHVQSTDIVTFTKL